MLITKIENEKGEVITSRKGIANVSGEFYNKLYDDNEQEETEQEIGENENESRRVANCNQQTQKKANPQTATESEQKTSKHATVRREKC